MNNNVGIIYCATFKNNKSYIGQTINFNKRKREHKSCAFNINVKSYNHKFYSAIRKYGFNDIIWTILEENIPLCDLGKREQYYIELYNTYYGGYNTSVGGENPPSQLGRKNPNVSKSNSLRTGNKHNFYGKNIAKDIRAVYWEITTPYGEILVIKNLNEYCKNNNLHQTLMGKVAKGERRHHKNFKCRKIGKQIKE